MNILVCGFMGAGKSTFVGRLAQNRLDFECLDLDVEIAKHLMILPNELGNWIKNSGLDHFRGLEITILKNIINLNNNTIIALGGGTVESSSYREIAQSCRTVYLNIPFQVCLERIKHDLNRPLLDLGDLKLEKLYDSRKKIYLTSDLILNEAEIKEIDGLETLVHNLLKL